jgi:hypothetical protein
MLAAMRCASSRVSSFAAERRHADLRAFERGPAGTAHRPEHYGGYGFVGIKQASSNSVHGDCVVGQMKKALRIFLIMFSPASADNQNVCVNFKLE